MSIPLSQLLPLDNLYDYKLHLACRNPEGVQPLDEFVIDRERWHGWNSWRAGKNVWTRPRILTLIDFYPRNHAWLFGGVYEVMERRADGYQLQTVSEFEPFTGRVIVHLVRKRGLRGRAFNLESHFDQMQLQEVLSETYAGESFPGYENINHDFGMLEAIYRTDRLDWRAALFHAKGIYLIKDRSNGKAYVGSAYGDQGIWSRWGCYLSTGHGFNDELTKIINERGIDYARNNFRFSVLEVMTKQVPDSAVVAREQHWKRVLMTRDPFGYNKN